MKELKLHSFGQNDHIESLKKKYDSSIKKIKENDKLNEIENTDQLKTLTKSFEKGKRASKNNLY